MTSLYVSQSPNFVTLVIKKFGDCETYRDVIFHDQYSCFGINWHGKITFRNRCCTNSANSDRRPDGHFFRNFASAASVAESLRSRCGSVRKAPECSSQGSSMAAAQVGQDTA